MSKPVIILTLTDFRDDTDGSLTLNSNLPINRRFSPSSVDSQ